MKLIFCRKCQDVVKLQPESRSCKCGLTYGRYLDDSLHAVVSKEAVVLGLDNNGFALALRKKFNKPPMDDDPMIDLLLKKRNMDSLSFKAFIISDRAQTIRRSDKP